MARITDRDTLSLVTVAPDGTERTLGPARSLSSLRPPYEWEDGQIWLAPDDVVLTEVRADHDDPSTYRLLRIDWSDPGGEGATLPLGAPIFLTGGVLALVGGEARPSIVRLYGEADPDGVALDIATNVGVFGATADRSLLVGIRSRDTGATQPILDPVVVGRDGTVAPWSPGAGIALSTGRERTIGAGGETLSGWFDDGPSGGSSGLNIVRPGVADKGRNIAPGPGGAGDWAWTADGTGVVMATDVAIYRWTAKHGTVKVRDVPADWSTESGLHIVGMTADAVILSDDFQGIHVLPFDGRAGRTTPGILLAIVP